MKILLVAATGFEVLPLVTYLRKNFKSKEDQRFFSKQVDLHLLITGVGSVATTFALATRLAQERFDWAINLGIAGAFDTTTPLGKVFQVVRDRLADVGIEEADGRFVDVFELGLTEADEPPYQGGWLTASEPQHAFLPQATALTVNTVHGSADSIAAINQRYPADLESMEGAAFFYCCTQQQIPCLQLRAVSNHVEPRNKDHWNIPLAIENLNEVAIDLIQTLNEGV